MPLRKASLTAIAFTLAATCLFAIMDTTTKYVVQTVPVLMALWARYFLLALAYQRAPATEVVPYMYSQVGFAVLFGWIVFGELPGTLAGAGIVLIILSGLGNAWQMRQRQRP